MELRFFKIHGVKTSKLRRSPLIRFHGDWLGRAGFEEGQLTCARFTKGEAVFELCGPDTDVMALIRKSREEKGVKLLIVKSFILGKKHSPIIEMSSQWLEDFEFSIGGTMLIKLETGVIRAKVITTDIFEL